MAVSELKSVTASNSSAQWRATSALPVSVLLVPLMNVFLRPSDRTWDPGGLSALDNKFTPACPLPGPFIPPSCTTCHRNAGISRLFNVGCHFFQTFKNQLNRKFAPIPIFLPGYWALYPLFNLMPWPLRLSTSRTQSHRYLPNPWWVPWFSYAEMLSFFPRLSTSPAVWCASQCYYEPGSWRGSRSSPERLTLPCGENALYSTSHGGML